MSDSAPQPPPHEPLLQIVFASVVSRALFAVTEKGIPDLLAEGPRASEDLAGKVGVNPPALHRVLRALAGFGFFTHEGHTFGLTPLGETLVSGHPTAGRELVLALNRPGFHQSFGAMSAVLETGKTGAELALGQGFFEYLRANPEEETIFNRLMIAVHGGEPAAVAEAYDFSGIDKVVDVGGGIGTLLVTVLQRHPHLTGVLFDAPSVMDAANATIAAAGLESRCEAVGGDFFASVPAGGDAYLLSHIIHDWDEAQCHTILGHCREAMNPDGRLLIVEMVLPEGAEPHPGKLLDVVMLAIPGGQERTADEYRELLAPAGFRVERVVPTASPVSVVEAVPA